MNIMGIAVEDMQMSGSRLMTSVGVAVLDKNLDVAKTQGAAIEEMLEAAYIDPRMLDTYA